LQPEGKSRAGRVQGAKKSNARKYEESAAGIEKKLYFNF